MRIIWLRASHRSFCVRMAGLLTTIATVGASVLLTQPARAQGQGQWFNTASMNKARCNQTETVLFNGQVLVTGGKNATDGTVGYSAELYNPNTATWTLTPPMNYGHGGGQTATLLPNGKVLVAGAGNATSCELYNPSTGTWAITGSMHSRRQYQAATSLPNGEVLVVGGLVGGIQTAEIYDPNTEMWTTNGYFASRASTPTATLLSNGKVLVTWPNTPICNLYDSSTGTWTTTGSMNTSRGNDTATLLPNGKVLVAGGLSGGAITSAELYDPNTQTWTVTGSLNTGRYSHTATLLPNGLVLVCGGQTGSGTTVTSSAEVYDPSAGTWTTVASLNTARTAQNAALLPNGLVLITGGSPGSGYLSSAELYQGEDAAIYPTGFWDVTDISDPANPIHIGELQAPFGSLHNATRGSYNMYAEDYNLPDINSPWHDTGGNETVSQGFGPISYVDSLESTWSLDRKIYISGDPSSISAYVDIDNYADLYVNGTFVFHFTDTVTADPVDGSVPIGSYLHAGENDINVIISGDDDGFDYFTMNTSTIGGIIRTVVGSYAFGGTYSGDGGSPLTAGLSSPTALAVDKSGALYIADSYNKAIRTANSSSIRTIANCGTWPSGIAVDNSFDIFVADANVSGLANFLYQSPGTWSGPIYTVSAYHPGSVATAIVNLLGSPYFADESQDKIFSTGYNPPYAYAGNGVVGYQGDNGLAINAEINISYTYLPPTPSVPSVSGPIRGGFIWEWQGQLYIADIGNNVVRYVDASNKISTVAGNGTAGYSGDNNPAINAMLNHPSSVALDAYGNLYIADTGNNVIRKVDLNGNITTVAGTGVVGYSGDGGSPTAATLNAPTGLAFDPKGNLYFVDAGNNVIRELLFNP